MKYQLPGGRWDWKSEATDFLLTVIRTQGVPEIADRWPIVPYSRVENLSAQSFVAHDGSTPISVLSVTLDKSSHRTIFITENGKRMTPAGRKIESAVISDILSKARPEDSFAFLTVGGPRLALGFGSSRDELRVAVEGLERRTPGGAKGQGVLDAVMEATRWFRSPQPGDSIFVMATHLEGRHKVKFSEVLDAITSSEIHVIGLQLGWTSAPGQLQPEYSCVNADAMFGCADTIPRTTWDQMFRLCSAKGGGGALYENTHGKQYRLTDDRLRTLVNNAEQMYRGISEKYILQLSRTGPRVGINLTPSALEQYPWVQLIYPENLPSCPPGGTSTGL